MKDSLFSNKLAAAILLVLLFAVGLPTIGTTMITLLKGHHGDHHYDEANPFDLHYVPYAELVGVPSGDGAAAEEVVTLGCLLAEASADRGARGAQICASCHSLEKDGANMTGPALWNVMGRDIASVDGFGYSGALREVDGDWTYAKMDQYLYDSGAYVPGTAMAQKIRKDSKRADILAYLGTLRDGDPLPMPACETGGGEEVAEAAM